MLPGTRYHIDVPEQRFLFLPVSTHQLCDCEIYHNPGFVKFGTIRSVCEIFHKQADLLCEIWYNLVNYSTIL